MDRGELNDLIGRAERSLAHVDRLRSDIASDVQRIVDDIVVDVLRRTSVDELKSYLPKGTRVGGLKSSRYRSAADVYQATPAAIAALPGIGPQSAYAIHAAAVSKAAHEQSVARVRLDPQARTPQDGVLAGRLLTLHAVDARARRLRALLNWLHAVVDPMARDLRRHDSGIRMFFSGTKKKAAADAAAAMLERLGADPALAELAGLIDQIDWYGRTPSGDVWADYEREAAAVNALLSEFAPGTSDVEASHGYVPNPIVQQAELVTLDLVQLTARLRGYQAFGAQYALSRRRVIIGDEMGLGKTVQALAVAAHLAAADGVRHFLVICPASVVVNWANEVAKHSLLVPYEVVGDDREEELRRWASDGGVAITTFNTVQRISLPNRPGLIIVDEAHYLKNPAAQRSRWIKSLLDPNDRVLFLSGTPMENRIDEFRNLVDYVQPTIARQLDASDGLRGPLVFRKTVAPVYLRRNQEDVLTELPDLIEAEEWVRLSGSDSVAYRAAVQSGNFMAMRQAAYQGATVESSAKLDRLVELVTEAQANSAKVIVFSYFLNTLEVVRNVLPGTVFGPLTGAVGSADRQALVDDFTRHQGSATLVAQIEAGGVGLNIQAASVVIIAEPQWKPSTEQQAIARAHRMGQLRTVQVHRILAKDTVDEFIRDIALRKSELFDEYARESVAKETSAGAVDASWSAPTQDAVVKAEQARQRAYAAAETASTVVNKTARRP